MASVAVQLGELFVAHLVAAAAASLSHLASANANLPSITTIPPSSVSAPTSSSVPYLTATTSGGIDQLQHAVDRFATSEPSWMTPFWILAAFLAFWLLLSGILYTIQNDEHASFAEELALANAEITELRGANVTRMAEMQQAMEKTAGELASANAGMTELRDANATSMAEMKQAMEKTAGELASASAEITRLLEAKTESDGNYGKLQSALTAAEKNLAEAKQCLDETKAELNAADDYNLETSADHAFQVLNLQEERDTARSQSKEALLTRKYTAIWLRALRNKTKKKSDADIKYHKDILKETRVQLKNMETALTESDGQCRKLEKGMKTLRANMSARKAEAVADAMEGGRNVVTRILEERARIMGERDEARKAVLAWKFSTIWRRNIIRKISNRKISNTNTDHDSSSDSSTDKPPSSSSEDDDDESDTDGLGDLQELEKREDAKDAENARTGAGADRDGGKDFSGEQEGSGHQDYNPDEEFEAGQNGENGGGKKNKRGKRGSRVGAKINMLQRKRDARAARHQDF